MESLVDPPKNDLTLDVAIAIYVTLCTNSTILSESVNGIIDDINGILPANHKVYVIICHRGLDAGMIVAKISDLSLVLAHYLGGPCSDSITLNLLDELSAILGLE